MGTPASNHGLTRGRQFVFFFEIKSLGQSIEIKTTNLHAPVRRWKLVVHTFTSRGVRYFCSIPNGRVHAATSEPVACDDCLRMSVRVRAPQPWIKLPVNVGIYTCFPMLAHTCHKMCACMCACTSYRMQGFCLIPDGIVPAVWLCGFTAWCILLPSLCSARILYICNVRVSTQTVLTGSLIMERWMNGNRWEGRSVSKVSHFEMTRTHAYIRQWSRRQCQWQK